MTFFIRQLNMKHEVVREISAKSRRALCVVVGVITTTKPCKITATLNVKVDGDAKVRLPFTHISACLGEWEQITHKVELCFCTQ